VILVGSKNPHKLHEVREILQPLGIRAVIAVNLPEVEETGATFAENAAQKALAFASFLRAPCLSDDSGLVIPSLDGDPGIRSARYAGEPGDDTANLRLVLKRLEDAGLYEPSAYFQCNIAVAVAGAPGRVVVETEGRIHGHIVHEPRGEHGFGYDPIFFHPESGCTTAELPPEQKNRISHRAEALRALATELAKPEIRESLGLS
jgi:XTP/dITP diphosphohydrolase